jgi:hypothetical protein
VLALVFWVVSHWFIALLTFYFPDRY